MTELFLPEANDRRCLSADGWLLTVCKDESEVKLVHPFTHSVICLPEPSSTFRSDVPFFKFKKKNFLKEVVLSSNPLCSNDDFLVMVLWDSGSVAYFRPGDDNWTTLRFAFIYDITYFKRRLYTFSVMEEVDVYEVHGCNSLRHLTCFEHPFSFGIRSDDFSVPLYMLGLKSLDAEDEGDDRLLLIFREGFYKELKEECRGLFDDKEVRFVTTSFAVFEFNLNKSEWSRIESLGDRTVFVGSTVFAMNASDSRGVLQADSIYFTDDGFSMHCQSGSKDTGIYHMSDGTIEPLVGKNSGIFSPQVTWIEPCSY